MEDYFYIGLFVIIEAMIMWILEWRERGWEEITTISWLKRRLLKTKKRRRRRILKKKQLARQRILLLSYLRSLPKVKLDETATEDSLASEDESNHVLVPSTPLESAESSTSETVTPPADFMGRPFLYDLELTTANSVSQPSAHRPLIPWTDFDDVTVDDDVLTGKDMQPSWDCNEMFQYNETHFGFKSTFDQDLSEYTTPLIREDTNEYQLRWERACRLSEQIKTQKLTDQATQLTKKKQRKKKAIKANIAT